MRQFNLFFSLLLISVLSGCNNSTSQADKKKPNLIFILTDEQRYDTSAPYGNDQIITPNLNSFGKNGAVFETAYVSMPVCSPARATILTGLYPHTSGVTNNNIPLGEDVKTLPELMADTTYQTAYIGKWHLGRENEAWHGFDYRISTEDGYTAKDSTNQSDYNQWLQEKGYEPDNINQTFSRGFVSELPYEHSKSKYMEDKGLEFLERNKEQPFIMYLSFLEPHTPYNGPFNDVHDTTSMTFDSTYYMTEPTRDAPLRHHMARGYNLKKEFTMNQLFANYWGLVHQVDLSVGKVLAKLKALGLDEHTIVVFTSEHGTMLGKYGLYGKTVMYEESSRVPFMIKAPGVDPITIDQPVSHIDLVPTLLELLEQPVPGHLEGKSLLPLMKGETTATDPIFMEWNPFKNWQKDLENCPDWAIQEDCREALLGHTRTVVTPDGWKLNWNTRDKSQLFNLNEDPTELYNLYEKEEYQEQVKRLKDLIRDWQLKTNDEIKFNEV